MGQQWEELCGKVWKAIGRWDGSALPCILCRFEVAAAFHLGYQEDPEKAEEASGKLDFTVHTTSGSQRLL
jgi:hypothetical protein